MLLTIGERLKELRQRKRLRQEQVAAILGVSKSTISSYENSMRQPSLETVVALARLYHVSTDYLLGMAAGKTLDVSELTNEEIDVLRELVFVMENRKSEQSGAPHP